MKRENLLIVGAILLLGCSASVESSGEQFFAKNVIEYGNVPPYVSEWDTPTGYHCIWAKLSYAGGLQCFKVQP